MIAAGRVAGTYATQLEMTAAAEMLMIHVQLHTPSSITAYWEATAARGQAAASGDHRHTVHVMHSNEHFDLMLPAHEASLRGPNEKYNRWLAHRQEQERLSEEAVAAITGSLPRREYPAYQQPDTHHRNSPPGTSTARWGPDTGNRPHDIAEPDARPN